MTDTSVITDCLNTFACTLNTYIEIYKYRYIIYGMVYLLTIIQIMAYTVTIVNRKET